MENEVVVYLQNLYALLSDKKHWTTKVMARDRWGTPVPENSEKACCWCLLGGLEKVCRNAPRGVGNQVFDLLRRAADSDYTLGEINDHDGHGAVMGIIRKAIELASRP